MANYRKYTPEQKEKAIALMAMNTIESVAKQLRIPQQTLRDWKKKVKDEPDFVELRYKKKHEFINEAWDIINLANNQVKKTIDKATAAEAARIAGIYYDKQALANDESTSNVNQEIKIVLDGDLKEWAK